jgi:hypothetical protein
MITPDLLEELLCKQRIHACIPKLVEYIDTMPFTMLFEIKQLQSNLQTVGQLQDLTQRLDILRATELGFTTLIQSLESPGLEGVQPEQEEQIKPQVQF